MDERRNLYRLLHLQPDAPSDLVRANYRTLMMKLERHPDLGGDHWNAALLGSAYATLKDPTRRATYDRGLLERYDLARLSRGPAAARPSKPAQPNRVDPDGNQRSYYRVLGVQQDSPGPILEAAFRALRVSSKSDHERILLDSAFWILCDSDQRLRYDENLQQRGHAFAAQQATERMRSGKAEKEAKRQSAPDTPPPKSSSNGGATPKTSALVGPHLPDYEPLIQSYCAFCMTPHGHSKEFEPGKTPFDSVIRCRECASPLFSPPADLLALGRREISRLSRDEAVVLHVDWPGPRVSARTIDISPTGLSCETVWPIETGERLRIDLSVLCAVGEVTHHERPARSTGEITKAGIRFLTVAFVRPKGGFLSMKG